MYIKRTYNFIIDKEKDKLDGKLRFRVKWNSNKSIVAFNLGFRVDPTKWSKEAARCKNNTTHGDKKISASIINRKIQDYENFADEVFAKFEAKEVLPTVAEFRASFLPLIGREVKFVKSGHSIFDIFDEFTSEMGRVNDWSKATHQKFAALRKKLVDFAPKDFDSFNNDGLNRFVLYLREEYEMRNSSIGKQLGFLKWFLRWAQMKEYSKQTAYQIFSPKLKQTEKRVIFLTWEELMRVYYFKFVDKDEHLNKVRDVFCFCCFTSLRYSDVANLRRSDIGNGYINITTIKTSDNLRIELNDYSQDILDRYSGCSFQDDLALPVISNQKMNLYLKDIGRLCDINEPIREVYHIGNKRIENVYPKYALLGTHAGRRTFICNALMLGIAPNIVMKWTGHNDYKAMKPYIDIADKEKQEAMRLFNKK